MSLRWLTPGLAVVVALFFSCDNQGKGVGPDVIDELCELNREAVLALHSKEGMAAENDSYKYLYCDYLVDSDKDGIPDTSEVQGSCKPLAPTDMDFIISDCRRNGARILSRCQREMEAMLACMKNQLDQAPSRLNFFTDNFNCWYDINKNLAYDGGVFWTVQVDGSRPEADIGHTENCPINPTYRTCQLYGTCGSCGMIPALDADGNPKVDPLTHRVVTTISPCYLVKELPRKGDETLKYNNVQLVTREVRDTNTGNLYYPSQICGDEYLALNTCSKESELFLLNAAKAAASGTAGAGGVGTE